MIIPCIDLMDGVVVQLVQGREKALEGDTPEAMLRKFAGFPVIQVIDLDANLSIYVNQRCGDIFLLDRNVGILERTACETLEGTDGVLEIRYFLSFGCLA